MRKPYFLIVYPSGSIVIFCPSAVLTQRKGTRMEKGDRRKSPEPTMPTTVVTPETVVLPTVSLFLYSQSLLLIALLGPNFPNQEKAKP